MNKWVSKKYLDQEFYQIFERNRGKKIIVFSAGTALHTVPELLPGGLEIVYFIDSNYEKWQKENYSVKHPEELKKEEKGTFLVLIAGQHTISMKEQLESYGLKEQEDFVDLYGKYEKAFRIAKADYQAEQMKEFVQRIPESSLKRDMTKKTKIGIALTCTFLAPPMYDIALFLLLKKKGYDAELIVDDCYSNENITVYEGITEDVKNIVNGVLEEVKKCFKDITIKYVSDYKKAELTEEDLKLVEEAAHANAIWQRSRKIDRVMAVSEEEWHDLCYPIYRENLQRIKGFFEKNRYDVINIFTGLHGQRYFYPVLGERKGIRVSTYDGASLKSSWASNGRASHRMDICRVIKEDWLNTEQKNKIVEEAKKIFNRQSHLVDKVVTRESYQTGEREKITEDWFDVVIPLNVMWDAAALGRNKIFNSEFEWVSETVEFILKNTNANILVREHPAAKRLGFYNIDSFGAKLKEQCAEEKRLYIADGYNSLNTYEYMEHCKVVIPFSSTMGIEAVLLGKQVILHAEVYYGSLQFAFKAGSKEAYFEAIKNALQTAEEFQIAEEVAEEAWLAYYLGLNYTLETDFRENMPEWLSLSLEEVEKTIGVEELCRLITDGVPICYQNIEKRFDD